MLSSPLPPPPLPPTPRAFPFTQAIYFPLSLIHRGKHLPEGPLIIVPKSWFMFERMHADSSGLGTHSRCWKGRGTSCPARHGRWHAKDCSSLHLRNPGSFDLWMIHLDFTLFGFPPYFLLLFRVAKLPKEIGRSFYTGPSLQGSWKLAARLRLLEESTAEDGGEQASRRVLDPLTPWKPLCAASSGSAF